MLCFLPPQFRRHARHVFAGYLADLFVASICCWVAFCSDILSGCPHWWCFYSMDWFEKKWYIQVPCFSNSLDHQVISVSTCYMMLWFYYVFPLHLFLLKLSNPFFPINRGMFMTESRVLRSERPFVSPWPLRRRQRCPSGPRVFGGSAAIKNYPVDWLKVWILTYTIGDFLGMMITHMETDPISSSWWIVFWWFFSESTWAR